MAIRKPFIATRRSYRSTPPCACRIRVWDKIKKLSKVYSKAYLALIRKPIFETLSLSLSLSRERERERERESLWEEAQSNQVLKRLPASTFLDQMPLSKGQLNKDDVVGFMNSWTSLGLKSSGVDDHYHNTPVSLSLSTRPLPPSLSILINVVMCCSIAELELGARARQCRGGRGGKGGGGGGGKGGWQVCSDFRAPNFYMIHSLQSI